MPGTAEDIDSHFASDTQPRRPKGRSSATRQKKAEQAPRTHVVLGGAGSVGAAVLNELSSRGLPRIAVERSKSVDGVETRRADARDYRQLLKATEDASHIYLCIGLRYSAQVWEREWPEIMENVINVAAERQARLIFLDNIYMYGPAPLLVPITEEHPQVPVSRKGRVRKKIADKLLEAHASGKVRALIGRCADFYGPSATHGLLWHSVVTRLAAGKAPQWLGNPKTLHSYSYADDAGRALVELALDEEAYGQVWHLPVAPNPWTGEDMAAKLALHLRGSPTLSVLPKPLIPLLGLFIPILKEAAEMMYQAESDYIFSSQKFEDRYPTFAITSYRDGVRIMAQSAIKPIASSRHAEAVE